MFSFRKFLTQKEATSIIAQRLQDLQCISEWNSHVILELVSEARLSPNGLRQLQKQ